MGKQRPKELSREDHSVLLADWMLRVRKNINKICPVTNSECFYAHRPFDYDPNIVQCWAHPLKYAADVLERCPREDQ